MAQAYHGTCFALTRSHPETHIRVAMVKCLGECCCPPECNDDKCNCRCGETICMFGAFFFVAASAFFAVGWLFGWNGPHTMFQMNMTFHEFNMFWFNLSYITMLLGIVYAFCARGKSAFARELKEEDNENVPKGEGEAQGQPIAPVPYVMLPAEP